MNDLFKELEKLGTIMIMDKEEGDYAIITNWPILTEIVLEEFGISYLKERNETLKTWTFDFNIYYKGELENGS